jgi:hypothetical protein
LAVESVFLSGFTHPTFRATLAFFATSSNLFNFMQQHTPINYTNKSVFSRSVIIVEASITERVCDSDLARREFVSYREDADLVGAGRDAGKSGHVQELIDSRSGKKAAGNPRPRHKIQRRRKSPESSII